MKIGICLNTEVDNNIYIDTGKRKLLILSFMFYKSHILIIYLILELFNDLPVEENNAI